MRLDAEQTSLLPLYEGTDMSYEDIHVCRLSEIGWKARGNCKGEKGEANLPEIFDSEAC